MANILELVQKQNDQGILDLINETNLDVQNIYGQTALIISAYLNRSDYVQWLIEAGANIDLRDKDGNTALMIAAYQDNREIVTQLINMGANLHIKDKPNNLCATMLALNNGNLEIVIKLLYSGARPKYILQSAARLGYPNIILKCIELNMNANLNELLENAITFGKVNTVSMLLSFGATLERSPYDKSLLQLAIENGYPDVVIVLIEAGANFNPYITYLIKDKFINVLRYISNKISIEQINVILKLAASKGSRNIVSMFIRPGVDLDSALKLANENFHQDIVMDLIKAGAKEVKIKTSLIDSCQKGDFETVKSLVNKSSPEERNIALMYGIKHLDIVKLLLDNSANANFPVLIHACSNDVDPEIIYLLLKRGANPNKRGMLPLHVSNNLDTINLLIKYIKPNILRYHGPKLLMEKIKNINQESIIETLLKLDIDVNVQDQEKRTALMYACMYKRTKVVEMLLNRGARTNLKDILGQDAFHYACFNLEILNLLTTLAQNSANKETFYELCDEYTKSELTILTMLLEKEMGILTLFQVIDILIQRKFIKVPF